MMIKRIAVLALLLAAVLVLAAGCGGGNGGNAAVGEETVSSGPVDKADSAACAANRSILSTAAQHYYATEGAYPASIQALVPGYLQSVPACPSGGRYTLQENKATCSVHGN